MWYIGTINNDDSTFAVTDKVYDRAMPIDINTKVAPFKCREQESININASYLESLFDEAVEKHPLSPKGEDQIKMIDDYKKVTGCVIKNHELIIPNKTRYKING